jgi:hypothetical protein
MWPARRSLGREAAAPARTRLIPADLKPYKGPTAASAGTVQAPALLAEDPYRDSDVHNAG